MRRFGTVLVLLFDPSWVVDRADELLFNGLAFSPNYGCKILYELPVRAAKMGPKNLHAAWTVSTNCALV